MNQDNTNAEMDNDPSLSPPVDDAPVSDKKKLLADNTIKNYVILAMGTGLIPSALVDIVAITALEVKMIGDLARVYDFPVPHRLVRYKVLISLIGHAVYVGMLSITGGAAMYAVGKVFQKHYESGGTFLSSENSVLKNYFQEKYQEGKKMAPGYAGPATP